MKKSLIYTTCLIVILQLSVNAEEMTKPVYIPGPGMGEPMKMKIGDPKQLGVNPEVIRKQMFDDFSKHLNLSEDQKTKVNAILESNRKEAEELKKQMQEKMKALREKSNSEIRAILNDEQKKKFDELEAKKKQNALKREELMKKFQEKQQGMAN